MQGRAARAALWAASLAVAAFLLAPILAILPLSFSAGSFLHYPLPGLSLRWYRDFFASEFWLPALGNSLVIGSLAALLATLLATPAAFGLWRARGAWRSAAIALLLSPMVVPVIVTAVALLLAFGPLGLVATYAGMVIGHAVLGAPFVLVTVLAALEGFDPTQLRAAAACGAGWARAFFRVTLPQIAPGVFAGAVFAFAVSLDDVVIALFLAGPAQRTLPRQMFAGLNDEISLTTTAASALLILFAVLLMLTVAALRRRAQTA